MVVALSLPLAACASGGAGSAGSFSVGPGSGDTSAASTTPSTPTTTTSTATTPATTKPTAATPPPYTANQTNMFDVTTATSFDAVTAMHSLATDKDGGQLYRGNASTASAPNGRRSRFELTLAHYF